MQEGFQLQRLVVTGRERPAATLDFTPGLNVISGVSNSGKTYVLQCVDWIFGAKIPPKGIKESQGYDRACLELRTGGGKTICFARGLKGGGLEAWEGGAQEISSTPRRLASKHASSNTETVSHVLLSLFGSADAKVRKNARREIQSLSFRTLAHLFIVNELEILGEGSPILLENVQARTSGVAAFSYVLTGQDDSGLLPEFDPKVEKAVRIGRRDLLVELVGELEASLAEVGPGEDDDALERRLAEITSRLSESSASVSQAWKMREETWSALRTAESRLLVLRELGSRYRLLSDHYASDLRRLEFLDEGRELVEQLETVLCPFCGSALDGHVAEGLCLEDGGGSASLAEAANAEARKIRSQQRDLNAAMEDVARELSECEEFSRKQALALEGLEAKIRAELEPIVAADRQELEQLLDRRRRREARQGLTRRLQALQGLLEEEESSSKSPMKEAGSGGEGLDALALRKMCDRIESLLRAWRVPCKTVEFNEKSYDLVVDGIPRRSNGKGVRGLWHSAFSIGLMLAATRDGGRHPGFVVLDSPLTTLREGGVEGDSEEVDGEVQRAFFENLANIEDDVQIIVLENKEPPPSVTARINFVRFGGPSGYGRGGFFPTGP